MSNNTLIVIKGGFIQEIKSDDPHAKFLIHDLDLESTDDSYDLDDQVPQQRNSTLTEEERNFFTNY